MPSDRKLLAALAVTAALLIGCGGDSESSADPEVIVPEETAVPYEGYESTVGYLLSADVQRVVLLSPDGERMVFRVRPENLPTIGLQHLQSHAGVTDIGFQVFYEQQGNRRFIVGAEEVPPPGR